MSVIKYLMKRMDDKLLELMGPEAHAEFSAQIARDAFREEVDEMENCGFKSFVQENFDEITK